MNLEETKNDKQQSLKNIHYKENALRSLDEVMDTLSPLRHLLTNFSSPSMTDRENNDVIKLGYLIGFQLEKLQDIFNTIDLELCNKVKPSKKIH